MTLITFQDGKPVMRDGKVGTEQACCCGCSTCLTLSGRAWSNPGLSMSGCTESPFWSQEQDEADINAFLDRIEQFVQDLADNLTAAGWTATVAVVTRTVQTSYIECQEACESGECYVIEYLWDIRLTATCECCIALPELSYQNCGVNNDCELFDQPDGRWVNIHPLTSLPIGELAFAPIPVFGPDCADYAPRSLYGINGDYGVDLGGGLFGGMWVPVCTDSEWCENPLP
jgi:hypothetical protein